MEAKLSETLCKAERITSKRTIDQLFGTDNNSITAYPFRVVYMPIQQPDVPVSILVSVPKKRFHHAIDRNRMKRLVREAYRKQKHTLWHQLQDSGQGMAVAFICIAQHMCDYNMVYAAIGKALSKIAARQKELQSNTPNKQSDIG